MAPAIESDETYRVLMELYREPLSQEKLQEKTSKETLEFIVNDGLVEGIAKTGPEIYMITSKGRVYVEKITAKQYNGGAKYAKESSCT